MENTIERIYADAMQDLASATDAEAIDQLSTQYLGRKGRITHFLRNISRLPVEERPQAGKRANEIKRSLEDAFKKAQERSKEASKKATDRIDVSLPGRMPERGSLHPITQITNRICRYLFPDGLRCGRRPGGGDQTTTTSRPSIFLKTILPGTCRTPFMYRTMWCFERTRRPHSHG